MLKCPFCHFDNEDGALFCEQCKSDLTSVAPAPAHHAPPAPPMAMAEAIPFAAEPEPMMAEIVEAEPMHAEPIHAEPMHAEPVHADPIHAEPMHAEPVHAEPVHIPTPVAAPAAPVHVPMPAPIALATPEPVAPTAPPTAAPAAGSALPAGSAPRLLVLRGQKRNVEYPIYEGLNFVGRADDKPVDIDLEDQEPPDRVWCSRQHACISFENNELAIEDLNSANGTYVNRARIYPGGKRPLVVSDIVQIGNVQMKVVV